ncbi:MAG: hypothetical protein AAGB97_04015 [Dehalococcoidia bacterium]|nr:hypothetical protein [Chloroflexota bacterium]MBT9158811.1 hypothetical protein [Chloroflexota bacterium]MBT9161993.1 hypothetical protein [Chloroflexota bacterium]
MKSVKSLPGKFAICVNNADYPVSLELHKLYGLVPDEEAERDGDLRVIDESGEDYLYPAEYFLVVEFPQTIQQALQTSFARTVQPA